MSASQNAALVREYLERMGRGDPRFADLLADEVVWWVPPGSEAGGERRGKKAVLEFIGGGVEKYSATDPLHFTIEQIVADDQWACAQLVLEAKTAKGREYRNYFHIAFQIREGQIVLAKEYLDTKLAHDAFSRE